MSTPNGPSGEELRFAILAVDTVLFTITDGSLYVRLISVNRPPHFVHTHGLPGGLLHPTETAEESAYRHLQEKAGIDTAHIYSEQLYTFSRVDRDPRGRVVAVTYLALVPWENLSDDERLDSNEGKWVLARKAKNLAFDHDEVLKLALVRLRSRISYTTILAKLMPKEFTLTELEQTYESILKSNLDKRNFRKKVLKLGILTPLNKKRKAGRSRPAELYSFSSPTVTDIEVL